MLLSLIMTFMVYAGTLQLAEETDEPLMSSESTTAVWFGIAVLTITFVFAGYASLINYRLSRSGMAGR